MTCNKSSVPLLKSGEQRFIKAINKLTNPRAGLA